MISIFFTDPAPTVIYTLSLHDALPILLGDESRLRVELAAGVAHCRPVVIDDVVGGEGEDRGDEEAAHPRDARSEEHTSELQSRLHLVCRLLLEKKKNQTVIPEHINTTL